MKKTVLEVNNVYKYFWIFRKDFHRLIWIITKKKVEKELQILKGINFSITEGEVVGIVGKNGAGKSTILKIISGIYFPTMGEVKTVGKIASLIELGAGFEGEMTGRENIYIKSQLMGLSKQETDDVITDIIEFADIGQYIDFPYRTYSSGMGARLAFALAVNVDPDILIIDEVFAVGDANFKDKSQKKTEEFFKAGKTILLVSHSEEQIQQFCSRVIYLKDGHVAFDGDVDKGLNMFMNEQLNPELDEEKADQIWKKLSQNRERLTKLKETKKGKRKTNAKK